MMQVPPPAAMAFPLSPTEVKFHANASQIDLSFDPRMGRSYAGFRGKGTFEVVAEGLRVTAKRHRYGLNLGVGAVVGVIIAGGFVAAALHTNDTRDDMDEAVRGAPVLWFFGAILGAWITSLFGRLAAPQTALIPRMLIQSAQAFGPKIHIFIKGGDVQLVAPTPQAHQAVLQVLAASGVPVR